MNMYACTHYIGIHLVLHDVLGQQSVSSLNVTENVPIYEMPLTFAFGGGGLEPGF